MKKLERIGVSLESELLCDFDKLIQSRGYKNRSEAIRDLIRDQLSSSSLDNPKADAIAAVCMIYDHHSTKLMQKITALQHSHLVHVISSIHVHLDMHDCMEVIILKGKVKDINTMAENLLSLKGVKLGKINLLATDCLE